MAKYLVTGAAGFIGSNIVEELVRRGEEVVAFDNLSTGKASNLSDVMSKIRFIEGDITDLGSITGAARGADYILHQAALPSVPRSVEDPLSSHEANATGTLNVLLAARAAKVKRVVYASSSAVYGNSPTLPKQEAMPTDPLSPYAVNKLAGENYCKVFWLVYGVPTVALRYFNVFGPRQDPTSQYAAVIPAFIASLLEGKPPVLYGDGLQSRDFTYVSNVVSGNLLACEHDEAVGSAINLACGDRISLLDLVKEINALIGTNIEPVFEEPRAGDVKHSLADITQAWEKLQYETVVSFNQGLAKTIEYMQGKKVVG